MFKAADSPNPAVSAEDNIHLLEDFLSQKGKAGTTPDIAQQDEAKQEKVEAKQDKPKDDGQKSTTIGRPNPYLNLELGDIKVGRAKVADIATADADKKKELEKPVPVLSADGLGAYTRLPSGDWQLTDGKGQISQAHPDFPDKAIKNVERQNDGSVKLTLEGGQVVRNRDNGSRLHYADDSAFQADHPSRVYRSDNTYRDYEWDGNRLASFKTSNQKDRFYQVAPDQWANNPNAKTGWVGRFELDGKTGDFTREHLGAERKGTRDVWRADTINETHNPDGSMQLEVPYHDGTRRVFQFKETFTDGKTTLTQPESFKVFEANGTEHNWKKISGNQYECDGEKRNISVEVDKTGKYTNKYLDTGWQVVRTPEGLIEETSPQDKSFIRTEKGKEVHARIGENQFDIKYGADDKPKEIMHVNENRLWTRAADGSWSEAPIDAGKPYEKADQFEKSIVTHPEMRSSQKVRMLENVRAFRNMPQHSDAEKAEVFKQAERLMSLNEGSAFKPQEKANYADQLFWHIVNHNRNEQGNTNNCNVTVLRGLTLKEKPSAVAKVVADICEKGSITTMDGSTITPKKDSLRPRSGSPEDTFPPAPGTRTALGKLWDVTAIDTYYRRQEFDPFGNKIPKGAMWYEEVAPTGRSDTGSRIVWRDPASGQDRILAKKKDGNTEPIDSPRMYPSRIADSFYQITGQDLKDRFYLHQNRYVDNEKTFKNLCDGKIGKEKDVEDFLSGTERCRIIQGNTAMLSLRHRQQLAINKGEDPTKVQKTAGGEHVWLVSGYDKATKTVSIDNSWDPSYDMMNDAQIKAAGKDPTKIITMSLADLYQSMEDTSKGDSYTLTWLWRK